MNAGMRGQRRNAYLEGVRANRHVCFAEAMRTANRAITKFYSAYLDSADVGIVQMSLLIRLYYCPGISVTRLATEMDTDRTTLTRNLQVLERSGHLKIESGEDKRSRVVRLTDRGFDSMEAAIPLWRQAQRDLQAAMGQSDWSQMFEGLKSLAQVRPPRRQQANKAAIRTEQGAAG